MKQKTLFDEENRLELLSQLGDPLEILNRVIKWEKFRSVLNQGCRKEDTGKGGRPPYDVVMMFKILVLQRLYNLSDDQTEYQINDRMSFIGSDSNKSVFNLYIEGGRIDASSSLGAGIGSGSGGSKAKAITISGGIIHSDGGEYCAAIGGGRNSDCENINIANAVVYASSMSGAAIIGGGENGKGSGIYIDDSIVSLVQKNYCGYDMIGNGANAQSDAENIFITNSSIAFVSGKSGDVIQTSPIMSAFTQNELYPLIIANPDGADVRVDGAKAVANNNSAADPSDVNLYLWLEAGDHSIGINMQEIDFHFNYERLSDKTADAFNLCEADISAGYRHNETAHWYGCKGSDTCTVRFNYEEHTGTATCTEKAVCTVCDVEIGDPLGHDMEFFVPVKETCLTDGNLPYYHCLTCDKYFTNIDDTVGLELSAFIIPATGHDLENHAESAPTCVAEGNKEYYVCANCGNLYSDANGKNEVTLDEVTLAPTGKHTFGNWTITREADCTNDGSRVRSCANCDKTETER